MMPMARAMVTAVLLVAVGADLLSYHSYIWQAIKSPWRVVARWRTARGIQREIDMLPPIDYAKVRPRNNTIRFATLSELKEREQREQIRQAAEFREIQRLTLTMSKTDRMH